MADTSITIVSPENMAKKFAARVPAPTTATVTKHFDSRTSTFNLLPKHLRRTRAALGKALAKQGTFNLATLGDSTVGGVGATPGVNAWPDLLVGLLEAEGYPVSGSGLVAAWKASAQDSRLTITAGWGALSGASSLLTNSTTANPLTFASVASGTTARVFHSSGSGPFAVSIDGGTPVAVTPAGGGAPAVYSVTGLANTPHTITITRSSGNAQIFGFEVASLDYGIRLHNAGIGGQKIPSPASAGWFITDAYSSAPAGFNADLVLLMMETNDTDVTAVEAYKASYQASITRIMANGSDLVLVTAMPSSGKNFGPYTQALYELAESNDVPLIDLQEAMGTYALTNAQGIMSDGLHAKPPGYAVIARIIQTGAGL